METNEVLGAAAGTTTSYAILAAEPSTIPAGMQVIYFQRKTTTKNPVADADKYRCIVVPKYRSHQWETVTQPEAATEIFAAVLEEAVNAAAGGILLDFWQQHQAATVIPGEMLTFAKIIERMQAAQTSQRLNSEQIAAWYDASKTCVDAAARYGSDDAGKKKAAALREKFLSLASNNPAVMPALATKMLSYVNPDDAEHSVCKAVAKRLDRLQQVSVSADDL